MPFCSKNSSLLLSACLVCIELLLPVWFSVARWLSPFCVRLTPLPLPYWLTTAVWLAPNWPPILSPFQLLAVILLPLPWVVTVKFRFSPFW
ncbi:hypothetical protein D3C81_1272460 [compost metagenome]